jgi:acyl-CoA thioesterase
MTYNESNHPFDNATRLTGESDNYHGHTSECYANMVGPFGGIIAATLLRAIFDHSARQGDPLALTVNFVAPIIDGDFDIATKLVRTNRSTQHWSIELSQQDLIAATATVVFASRRKTWSSTESRFPSTSEAKESVRVSGEIFPSWLKNYDIRLIQGGVPPYLSIENEEAFVNSVTLQWVRDEPSRSMDFLSLTAICDAFFPRIYIRRNKIVSASTISFTVYFHVDATTLSAIGDKAVLGHARANRFYNNYFDQTAEVWTPDGELLATSSQVVYFKE